MSATRTKTNETATVLRAGRSRATVTNDAAKAVMKGAAKEGAKALRQATADGTKKRERVMVNTPVDMMPLIRAHAVELGVTMSTYYVIAVKEKLSRAE